MTFTAKPRTFARVAGEALADRNGDLEKAVAYLIAKIRQDPMLLHAIAEEAIILAAASQRRYRRPAVVHKLV
jgi:hypothetical protein